MAKNLTKGNISCTEGLIHWHWLSFHLFKRLLCSGLIEKNKGAAFCHPTLCINKENCKSKIILPTPQSKATKQVWTKHFCWINKKDGCYFCFIPCTFQSTYWKEKNQLFCGSWVEHEVVCKKISFYLHIVWLPKRAHA